MAEQEPHDTDSTVEPAPGSVAPQPKGRVFGHLMLLQTLPDNVFLERNRDPEPPDLAA